jgi:hypothetical protein
VRAKQNRSCSHLFNTDAPIGSRFVGVRYLGKATETTYRVYRKHVNVDRVVTYLEPFIGNETYLVEVRSRTQTHFRKIASA